MYQTSKNQQKLYYLFLEVMCGKGAYTLLGEMCYRLFRKQSGNIYQKNTYTSNHNNPTPRNFVHNRDRLIDRYTEV